MKLPPWCSPNGVQMSLNNEHGSAAPLAIGLALIALTVVLATSLASSMFLFQRRLSALADATAISVRQDIGQSVEPASKQSLQKMVEKRMYAFQSIVLSDLPDLAVQSADMNDGLTLQINLCAKWQAPFEVSFLPSQAMICSESAARPIG